MRIAVSIITWMALAGVAAAQPAPEMMPINELDRKARSYITQNGSILAEAGVTSAAELIGRAILCRVEAGRYVLEPQTAYPIAGATKYVADSAARPEPLSILAQGTLSGNLVAGPISSNGDSRKLTRLDITETGRLAIDLADGEWNLNRLALMRLYNLSGNVSPDSSYTHWCVIRAVSSWTVRYEGYDRRSFSASAPGVWIASGGVAYGRNVSAVVPYSVLTVAISPYARSWIKEQALLALNSSGPIQRIAVPATPAVSGIVGVISSESLARGDRASALLSGTLN